MGRRICLQATISHQTTVLKIQNFVSKIYSNNYATTLYQIIWHGTGRKQYQYV